MPVPISGESRVSNPTVCLSWSEWEKRRPATFPFAGTAAGSVSAVFRPLDSRDTIPTFARSIAGKRCMPGIGHGKNKSPLVALLLSL
jgi:hypothetical protein